MNKFISFITAGDPSLAATREFIDVLAEYSDFIEVGLPFSDPIAEGAVIEAANLRALDAGATTDGLFDILSTVNNGKMVILTYANPVFVYGYERFFGRCKDCGVYGVIIPDLPHEEKVEVASVAEAYGVHLITLIAPTSANRVEMLARDATGFIYLVSSLGVTGVRDELTMDMHEMIAKIRSVTDIPVYIGFGISTPEQAALMRELADGIIVGSALVKIIAEHQTNAAPKLKEYLESMRV